jgi:hypothetical protein
MVDRLCGLEVRVPGYRSRGLGFHSRPYHIFWEVVGLERGPFSLVSTTEEILGRKKYYATPLYPQKLALTSPTSGGRSVGIVRSRTKGHGVTFFFS